jgi:flagellar hook-basal body complex protein FliE
MNDTVDFRYRDDAFDLRRSTDNPLLENQENKTNWDKSNKVVGFNVDIGPQNQQIFKQFDVSQDPGLPTSESLEVLNQMANLDRNRGGYSQSVSLYNLYKNRSYKCSIDMMGNALMQPMMYFNLRNVPMFSGPYMITKVAHRISENGFDTTIEGQRQPFYSIPKIESYIQSLSKKILENIREQIQQTDKIANAGTNDVIGQVSDVINNTNTKISLSANQTCGDKLIETYKDYTTETPTSTSINIKDLISKINDKVNAILPKYADTKLLGEVIYSIISLRIPFDTTFTTYNNNYGYIPLTSAYGGSKDNFKKTYFCSSNNTPLASFNSVDSFIDFMISKYSKQLIGSINKYNNQFSSYNTTRLSKSIVKFYILEFPTQNDPNVYDNFEEQKITEYEAIVSKAIKIYLENIGQ